MEFDDGEVLRKLAPARQDDLKSFSHLFYNASQRRITDTHLWFLVFVTTELSNFKAVQRLPCCLALLYCAMLANAMLANTMLSSVIIFPVNLVIAGLFRNVSPKIRKEKKGIQSSSKSKKTQKRAKAYKGEFEDIVQSYRSQDAGDDELTTENVAVGLPPVETVNTDEKTVEWLTRNLDSCDSESFLQG